MRDNKKLGGTRKPILKDLEFEEMLKSQPVNEGQSFAILLTIGFLVLIIILGVIIL